MSRGLRARQRAILRAMSKPNPYRKESSAGDWACKDLVCLIDGQISMPDENYWKFTTCLSAMRTSLATLLRNGLVSSDRRWLTPGGPSIWNITPAGRELVASWLKEGN